MINTKVLKNCIEESGLKYKYIANKLGITPYGLQKKITNITEFKASEIIALCNVLALSKNQRDEIFFTDNVEYKSTSAERLNKNNIQKIRIIEAQNLE